MFLPYLVMCAYKLNNTESRFLRNPISQPDLLLLSIVMFGDHPRVMPFSLPLLSSTACLLVSFTSRQSIAFKNLIPPLVGYLMFPFGVRMHCLCILCTNEAINDSILLHVESTCPTVVTLPDPSSHSIVLPTNQVPWKTYYRRNLRKGVESPIVQMAQNDWFKTNSIDSHTDSKANDGFEIAILEHMCEQDSIDGVIIDGEDRIDENEVVAEHTENETNLDSTTIPKSIHLALECSKWKAAVMEEIRAMEKNETWDICTLPKGHKTVGCKWLNTIRVLRSVAVNKDWSLYQLDVKNAFLNEDLKEKVYMSLPPGFEAQFNNQIFHFHQVSRVQSGLFGHFLFTKVSKAGKIAISIVYVDDLVLSRDDTDEIVQLKKKMGFEFEIKDLGNLKYFFGMEVARSKEGISMS
ncbi:Cysteine-rich RLK (RECEPTOR-like protein kinase) 8 [Cucumis melo var. makuwa]|uniref:Cysteine-rich RLK (RECEPTOR-like protein kinase) 8 n=1 Tax=Cucumis melo var. makuwa TaxID=1194695 RepID=A0A5A7VGV8_CUCMM|nr:Cysteine-rich RLK (RECEPTOR-like protein kinase) 8 [Cucumis melo var. makuwa]